jgi:hypothetical protein
VAGLDIKNRGYRDSEEGGRVPGKRMSMRKTREVLRLYFELKLRQRQIARSANVSQSTVHEYVERFRAAELNWPLPAEMSESDLEGRLFPDDSGVSRPGAKTPPDFSHIHQELHGHKHTTLQLLWEEYRAEHADGYVQPFLPSLSALEAGARFGAAPVPSARGEVVCRLGRSDHALVRSNDGPSTPRTTVRGCAGSQ